MTDPDQPTAPNRSDALPDDGDDELDDTHAGADRPATDAEHARREHDRQLETGEESPT